MAKPEKETIFRDILKVLDKLSEDWEYSGEITPDTYVLADLELESIDMVVLGERLEENYKQSLPFAEYFSELSQRESPDIKISELVDFIYDNLS
ncbi:MAG: acyl carrier protein [Thermodesulfobacteriota bacterium]|nr:acyl carrier protein [Thermodesulfobacteriota bacterium]